MVVNVVSPQKTITTAKSEKGEMIITAEIVGDKMVSVIIFKLYPLFSQNTNFIMNVYNRFNRSIQEKNMG